MTDKFRNRADKRLHAAAIAFRAAALGYRRNILKNEDPTLITPLSFVPILEWRTKDDGICMPHLRKHQGQCVSLVGGVLNLFNQRVSEISIESWGIPESLLPALAEIHQFHASTPARILRWTMTFSHGDFLVSPVIPFDLSNMPKEDNLVCLSPTRIFGKDVQGRPFTYTFVDTFLESPTSSSRSPDGLLVQCLPIDKIRYLDQTSFVAVQNGTFSGPVQLTPPTSSSLLKNGPAKIIKGCFGNRTPVSSPQPW